MGSHQQQAGRWLDGAALAYRAKADQQMWAAAGAGKSLLRSHYSRGWSAKNHHWTLNPGESEEKQDISMVLKFFPSDLLVAREKKMVIIQWGEKEHLEQAIKTKLRAPMLPR